MSEHARQARIGAGIPLTDTRSSGERATPIPRWLAAVRPFNFGWLTVFASLALSLVGVYSIDVADALQSGPRLSPVALRQAVFVVLGLGVAGLAAIPHYRWFGLFSGVMYGGTLAFLVFLLIPAVPETIVTARNGARSWINLRVFDFQPSEPMKIAFVLLVAYFLRFRSSHRRFLGLVAPGLIAFIPVALIMLQPDLGTAALFIPALVALLIAAGARLRHLAIIAVLATAAAPAAYPFLKPHQKQRIVGLMKQLSGDRSADQDINFQGSTARMLAAAGGRAGLGDPRARALLHFNRLPERHNDMILSVIAARFGLAGVVLVLMLYTLWIIGAFGAAAMTREPLGRLIIVGFAAFIAAQTFVNVGMNLGVLPIIGITLPYLSYGGSSLITMWLMTGLVLNVALRREKVLARHSLEYADNE